MAPDSHLPSTDLAATDALVIGGGMYGCYIAGLLRRHGQEVVLVERADELLTRASYANQARVHNGYHYPRSVLTALRSHVNFGRFVQEFRSCIDDTFQMYYAIARHHSKVTARQFERFCATIGAPLAPAPPSVHARFDAYWVEAVFTTVEHAFDAVKLRDLMAERLHADRVDVRKGCEVDRITPCSLPDGAAGLAVTWRDGRGDRSGVRARRVFNCTYTNINQILARGGRTAVPLKHELTEMALVEVPPGLKDVGVTVMCGPFFSCMPFPARGVHTLSHVRYTPHGAWEERGRLDAGPTHAADQFECRSKFPHMLRDAARYLPELADSRQVGSLWELKTVLPQNEADDGRPILFKADAEWPALVSVMGGKIDNVFDLDRELSGFLDPRPAAALPTGQVVPA